MLGRGGVANPMIRPSLLTLPGYPGILKREAGLPIPPETPKDATQPCTVPRQARFPVSPWTRKGRFPLGWGKASLLRTRPDTAWEAKWGTCPEQNAVTLPRRPAAV